MLVFSPAFTSSLPPASASTLLTTVTLAVAMADGDQACIRNPVATASSGGGSITVDVSLSPCEGADEGGGATPPSDAPLPLPAGFDVALSASDSDADGLVTITAVSAVPFSSFSFLLQAPDGSLVALSGTDDPPSGAAPQAGFTVLVSTGPGGGKTRVNAFDPSGQSIGPFAEGTVLVVLQVSASGGVAGACVADASVSSGSVDVEGSPLRVSTDCEGGEAPPTPPPPPPSPPFPSESGGSGSLPTGFDVALAASESDANGLVTVTASSAVPFSAFQFTLLRTEDRSPFDLVGTSDSSTTAVANWMISVGDKVAATDFQSVGIGPVEEGTVLIIVRVSPPESGVDACVSDAFVAAADGRALRVHTDCADSGGGAASAEDVVMDMSDVDASGTLTVGYTSKVPIYAFDIVLEDASGKTIAVAEAFGGEADAAGFDVTIDGNTGVVRGSAAGLGERAGDVGVDSSLRQQDPQPVPASSEQRVLTQLRLTDPPQEGTSLCTKEVAFEGSDGEQLTAREPCDKSGAVPSPPPSPSGSNNASDGNNDGGGGGLSAGAIFGIVIGSTVGGVLLVALVVFLLSRRSRERRPAAISRSQRNGGVNGASGSSPQPPPGESDFTNKVMNVTNESAAGSPPINRPSRGGKGQFVELV